MNNTTQSQPTFEEFEEEYQGPPGHVYHHFFVKVDEQVYSFDIERVIEDGPDEIAFSYAVDCTNSSSPTLDSVCSLKVHPPKAEEWIEAYHRKELSIIDLKVKEKTNE